MRKFKEVAAGLRVLGVEADALISSPYLRAVQTAEIVAEALGVDRAAIRQTDALLPDADPAEAFRAAAEADGDAVMLFGHAPNLNHVLAYPFARRRAIGSLKKGGVACLELEVVRPPAGTLLWLLPPGVLRRVSGTK